MGEKRQRRPVSRVRRFTTDVPGRRCSEVHDGHHATLRHWARGPPAISEWPSPSTITAREQKSAVLRLFCGVRPVLERQTKCTIAASNRISRLHVVGECQYLLAPG